jgi:hypothetical protein
MMDDKAQMMVLESVLFAITILTALIFLYQLSPTSTISEIYTNDLKIKGDDALQSLYNDEIQGDVPQSFPRSKLIYYIITDNHNDLIFSNLRNMLPPTTMYNIYLSNGENTIFWCNSYLNTSAPLALTEPVTISHIIVAIHSDFLNATKFPEIIDDDGSELVNKFGINEEYTISLYDVRLEMCYI